MTAQHPYEKSSKALIRMRQRIFQYDGAKEAQADRVLAYLIARKLRGQAMEKVASAYRTGPYSGLTRRELAASGTCETDWF